MRNAELYTSRDLQRDYAALDLSAVRRREELLCRVNLLKPAIDRREPKRNFIACVSMLIATLLHVCATCTWNWHNDANRMDWEDNEWRHLHRSIAGMKSTTRSDRENCTSLDKLVEWVEWMTVKWLNRWFLALQNDINYTCFRPRGQIWLSSVRRARRLEDEKKKERRKPGKI